MAPAAQPTLAARIESLARARPRAPFLRRAGLRTVEWQELAARITDARERLDGWDLRPGDVVAGFDASRPAMAMACALLPASSTFAPLARTLTAEGYAAILQRLRARAVLAPHDTGHPLRTAAVRLGLPLVTIRHEDGADAPRFTFALDASCAPARAPVARPGHAYVLMTSGTTGRPKLVPVAHATMLAYADAMAVLLALGPGDIGVALAPFHFAGGLRASILLPALTGGSFACLDEGDVDGFYRALVAEGVTQVSAPFAIQREILRRASAFPDAIAASRLRYLRTTAGALHPDDAERLERVFRAPVLQALGSTEVPGIAHDPLPPRVRKRGSVGPALGGEVRAIDAQGRRCAPGMHGELEVRGPLVFDGYLDDAVAFDGDWLRTGDLGHVDADGYVFVTGRVADGVNRGGEKIAPAAVDLALERLPGVREGAAFGIPHPALGEELVAAVVVEPGAAIGEDGWLACLRALLPPAQVPRRIVVVDALPRNDAGKVERRSLARLAGVAVEARGDDLPDGPADDGHATALEAAIAALCATALGRTSVGRDDDWRNLGGDAAGATRVVHEIEAVFNVALGDEVTTGGPMTTATLARAVEAARRA